MARAPVKLQLQMEPREAQEELRSHGPTGEDG